MHPETLKPDEPPFLRVRGLFKRFGSIQALRNIDLDVRRGEVLGLLGDNGAGKSTLIKSISGVYVPEAGTIECEGKPVTIASPTVARSLGIETVFQDLALIPNLDAAANLFIGRELGWGPLKGMMRITRDRAMHEDARKTLSNSIFTFPRCMPRSTNSRAASARRSRLRAPSAGRRNSSSSTSRPPPSAFPSSARCWRSPGSSRRRTSQ